jgi:N-acyl-L-homoserine lactone synthetase
MSALFASLCPAGAPRDACVWEASRFCADPSLTRRARLDCLWQTFAALLETSFLYGIERLIFTANRKLLPLALGCGWEANVLGPTARDGDDEVTAVEVAVTQAGLRRLRARFGIDTPVIRVIEPRWQQAA